MVDSAIPVGVPVGAPSDKRQTTLQKIEGYLARRDKAEVKKEDVSKELLITVESFGGKEF